MVRREDKLKVKSLLKETITLLCKNGLEFQSQFCIEALIGITLDEEDVLLISINETVQSDKPMPSSPIAEVDVVPRSELDSHQRSRLGLSSKHGSLGSWLQRKAKAKYRSFGLPTTPKKEPSDPPGEGGDMGFNVSLSLGDSSEDVYPAGGEEASDAETSHDSEALDSRQWQDTSADGPPPKRSCTETKVEYQNNRTHNNPKEEEVIDLDNVVIKAEPPDLDLFTDPDLTHSQRTASSHSVSGQQFSQADSKNRQDSGHWVHPSTSQENASPGTALMGPGRGGPGMSSGGEEDGSIAGSSQRQHASSSSTSLGSGCSPRNDLRWPTALHARDQFAAVNDASAAYRHPPNKASAHGSGGGVLPRYQCLYCLRNFHVRDDLQGHMAQHTKVKDFVCPLCNSEFAYKKTLRKHLMRVHKMDTAQVSQTLQNALLDKT